MTMHSLRGLVSALVVFLAANSLIPQSRAADKPVRLLFLGDNGHHQPAKRFAQLQPVFQARGLELVYTDRIADLVDKLAGYDGLVLYANIDVIEPAHARALLDYVAGGKGFIPLHCASYCFRNNDDVVALIGGQFQRHGTGTFRVAPTDAGAKHPLLRGYRGFESWDETYVHTKHNERDRIVLETRVEGEQREPWTWVRTHGKGRVFYTAWGHDERTWSNPGFANLVERGVRWAIGQDPGLVPAFADRPEMTPKRTDVRPFEFVDATIPFYPPGKAWGSLAGPVSKMQKPLPADESVKHFVTPVGFEVRPFAADPQIGKPLAMNWDERGRLWLCETVDYPNELQPPGQGRDRIRVCEDTDGDGRADKFTVFAEQLSIPTAITFYRGGAIVQDGTQTLFLKDTDGDGRADVRKVLLASWAMGDTHGGVSNLQMGLDNWVWGMQGYNLSAPDFDGQKSQSFRMGFFRFRLDGQDPPSVAEIEFLRSTNNNTWGLGFSEEGLVFGSTANGNPSEFLPIPNRFYERVRGWSASVLTGIAESNKFEPITDNVRQVDHHGGFTAAAGHALYTARAWPAEYWNRTAFVTEPTGHLVATFVLNANGAGFRSKNSWNIVASDDEWSAPIMAEVGPDGQLWVLDWYNIIVQHNPTPAGYKTGKGNAYEIGLRDKKHGRIYRVVHTSGDTHSRGRATLAGATPPQLVDALRDDNFFWRRHAQRLLVERGQRDVVPALVALVRDASVDAIGLNPGAIHALGTLNGLGALADDTSEATAAARDALKHSSAGVRRNALAVLPRTAATQRAIVDGRLLEDRDAQVRLAALLALSECEPSVESARAIAAALHRPINSGDRWLRDGLVAAAAKHDRHFLAESLAAAQRDPANRTDDAAEREVVRRVAEHFARGHQADAPAGGLSTLLTQLAASTAPAFADEIISGLNTGWPKDQRPKLDEPAEAALAALVQKLSPASRAQLVTLASRWGSQRLESYVAEIATSFRKDLQNDKAADEARIAAAQQLVDFRRTDVESARLVLDQLTPRVSPALGQGLVEALGRSEAAAVGEALSARLPTLTPQLRRAGLSVLLSRADWTGTWLDACEGGKASFGDLTLDQKQALAAHPNKKLAERAKTLLAKGGGLPNPDRQKVLESLLPLTKVTGDVKLGKEVFKKQCLKCHTHSGEGAKIGPDLTGMAVHPKHELLVHLIDPSRNVEGNFRVYSVALANGRVLNGLLLSESKTAVELVDAEAKKHVLQRDEIDELVVSPKSLMPEGFEKQVSPEDITNLLEFLTQRGKFLPIPLDKVATVVSTKGMFYAESSTVERLVFADWGPKTFEGVPFVLVDPQGDRMPNVVLLNGPHGVIPPRMPRTVSLPCNAPAKAIHLLSGVGGWSFPAEPKGGVSLIVRLRYADGEREDHKLVNGEHFADYIRRVDVPGSKFAFALRGQQVRYLAVYPQRSTPIEAIDLVKGDDRTAPVVMAVTVEGP